MNRSRIAGASRRRRLGIALAILAAAALGLSACSAPGGAAPTSSATKGGTTDITVAVVSNGPPETPFYVAMEKGIFKKHGLNVTSQTLSGGQVATDAALTQGSIDVALAGMTSFIQDQALGAIKGKVFGVLNDSFYDIVAAPGIKSLADLQGKAIGISSQRGSDQVWYEAVLKAKGLDPQKQTYLALGPPATRLAAMAGGKIAATVVPVVQLPDKANVVLTAKKSPVTVPATAFYAGQNFFDANKGALKEFMAAMGEATTWSIKNPTEAQAICEKDGVSTAAACLQTISVSSDKSQVNAYTWSSTGAINTDSVNQAIKAISEFVPQAKNMKLKDIVDTSVAGTKP